MAPSTNQFQQNSKFVSKRFIYASDGTIEQHQIIKDNEGNEEKRVSKQIGDKKYVVTTKRDKNGVETKVEDLINIDESKLLQYVFLITFVNINMFIFTMLFVI